MECQSTDEINPPCPWGRLLPCLPNLEKLDLFAPIITIGRAESCDITINVPSTISKEHCCLIKNHGDHTVYISDFSKNGTFLNKNRLIKGQKYLVHDKDIIALGNSTLQAFIFKLVVNSMEISPDLPREIQEKYVSGAVLSRGAFKQTKLLFEKATGNTFTVKKIANKGQLFDLKLIKSLSNPYLLEIRDIVECDNEIFIISNFLKNLSLSKVIVKGHSFSELKIKLIIHQISLALQYFHKNQIFSVNLKPQNIFLLLDAPPFPFVKLTDYFLNEVCFLRNFHESWANFAAPELLDAHEATFNEKVDVWSLGKILYLLIFQNLPSSYDFCNVFGNQVVSNSGQNMLQRMLDINPDLRINLDDVLEHTWMKMDSDVIGHKMDANCKSKQVKKLKLHHFTDCDF